MIWHQLIILTHCVTLVLNLNNKQPSVKAETSCGMILLVHHRISHNDELVASKTNMSPQGYKKDQSEHLVE